MQTRFIILTSGPYGEPDTIPLRSFEHPDDAKQWGALHYQNRNWRVFTIPVFTHMRTYIALANVRYGGAVLNVMPSFSSPQDALKLGQAWFEAAVHPRAVEVLPHAARPKQERDLRNTT